MAPSCVKQPNDHSDVTSLIDEFVVHLAEWSERVLVGESISNAHDAIQHRLSICPKCKEEFKLLTEVLAGNSKTDKDNS